MKKSLVKNKYIAFTFSLRVVGFDATLDWLKANFPELSVENRNINRYVPEMKRRQYIKLSTFTEILAILNYKQLTK